jgi:hypothetical protein
MSSRVRTVAGASLVAVLAFGACTVKDHPDDPNATAGSGTAGSEGGRSGSATAGSSSKAGRGGTTAKGGSAGVAGTGGDAGAGGAPACPGCDSGFCLDDGTCVDCLPSNDHCPASQYCTDEYECVSGCKTDGSSCASGICDTDHNCTSCIKDDECVEGLVCNSGACGAACTEAEEGEVAACGDGLICCSLHCTDVAINSNHCGACGADCGAGEFCGIDACADGQGGAGSVASPCVACHPMTLANICSIAEAVVILDTVKNPQEGNRDQGRAIGAALKAKCSPTPVLTEEEQDSVAALNFTTGRPVSGGRELLIVAGGPFFQNLEVYVEKQRIAPVYWHATEGNVETQFRKSSDDSVIASLPLSGIDHDSRDLFLIQFMRDAASGSLVLNAQGFWLSGTVAAAFQLKEGMLPNLSTFDQAWYVYEWVDMDDDKLPDLAEITLQASGR